MDHIHAEILISLVKERPVLWDTTCEAYKDVQKRHAAWREIYRILRPEYDSWTKEEREYFGKCVHGRWGNLRSCFKRAEKQEKQKKKYGRFHKPYIYKNQLNFLSEYRRVKLCEHCKSSESDDDMDESEMNKEEDSLNREDSSSMFSAAGPSTPSEEVPVEYNNSWSNYSPSDRRTGNPLHGNHRKEESPHLLFFKGILPSVEQFNLDETLELRADIVAAIQSIRKERVGNRNGK